MTDAYQLATAPPARRALATLLPLDVATAAAEFITEPLLQEPCRAASRSVPSWPASTAFVSAANGGVLYEIDETERVVIVLDIRHPPVVYRRR